MQPQGTLLVAVCSADSISFDFLADFFSMRLQLDSQADRPIDNRYWKNCKHFFVDICDMESILTWPSNLLMRIQAASSRLQCTSEKGKVFLQLWRTTNSFAFIATSATFNPKAVRELHSVISWVEWAINSNNSCMAQRLHWMNAKLNCSTSCCTAW